MGNINTSEKLKVFISQPMAGRTDEEILKERNDIMDHLRKLYADKDVVLVNSFFDLDIQSKRPNVRMLGMSIELLAEVDLMVQAPNWFCARGCNVENLVASEYDIPIMDMDE